MTFLEWLPTIVLLGLLTIGYATRHSLRAWLESGIRHSFNAQLERIRAELRENEERLKSDLRSKEGELFALRESILTGRTNRQAILDKRRLVAVERVWQSVMELAPYKFVSGMMASVNYAVAAKEAPKNPKVREFFEMIGSHIAKTDNAPDNPAKNEKPFVSPLAWAYFSAYQMIIMGSYAQAKTLGFGLEDAHKFFDHAAVKNLLKATLPEREDFIEKYDTNAYYYLLDELEDKLLTELKKMLDGSDTETSSVAEAARIADALQKVVEDRAQAARE